MLSSEGWALLKDRLSVETVSSLREVTAGLLGDRAGTRSVLDTDWGITFVRSSEVQGTLAYLGAPAMFCVRAVLFDKHSGANWKVPWHQDRKIAVKERQDVEGFRGWSVKEGTVHCQPTPDVLEDMLTLRFHLDDCDVSNGPLKVLPGTHDRGLLTMNATERMLASVEPVLCTCRSGDAIAMKPLLLHASSSAERVDHRRVLHLEFAGRELPGALEWQWRI